MKYLWKNISFFILLIVIICCLLLVNGCMAMPTQTEDHDLIATAFLATKANLEEMRLSGWSHYGEKASLEQMQQAAQETAALLRLGNLQASSRAGDLEEYILAGENSYGDWQLIFQANEDGTYLIINLLSYAPVQTLPQIKNSLREALIYRSKSFFQEKISPDPSTDDKKSSGYFDDEGEPNCLIIGSLSGNLSQLSLRNRFARAIESCGGILVEEASEENYFSQCAYIPNLIPVVSIQKKSVNLHLAASYDEQEDLTFIYLGCPMIYSDY